MNKNIISLLKAYNLSDAEIQDLETIEPMIGVISYDNFIQNCNVLVSLGYPKYELDFLFLSKTYLFVLSKSDLEKELLSLMKKGGFSDLETALREG